MSEFVAYDKIHNLSIEIKQLQGKLARAKKAYARLAASRDYERKVHQEQMMKAQKMAAFYKGKFMLVCFGKPSSGHESK